MKPEESYYPYSVNSNEESWECGISIRDKLAHEHYLKLFELYSKNNNIIFIDSNINNQLIETAIYFTDLYIKHTNK